MITGRISVVGVACRFPDADGPEELWQNVLAGRRAFRRIPEVRLPTGYRGDRGDIDRTYLSHAAVLRDWEFDRADFGVPVALHRAADHTHWLALETAAAALADTGHPRGDGLDRSSVGVVLGNSLTGEFTRAGMLRLRWPFLAEAAGEALRAAGADPDLAGDVLTRLESLVKRPFPAPGDETLAGALSNTIAGRICNAFDFHGTGYTVDGACSSSLLAVNTACTALAAHECDVIIAGGVDMSLDPFELVGFARLGALAADEMRVYDAEPTGFLPGEGCGMVVLMRADDAQARGLRVYADIVGWATSSDGAGGLTRPSEAGQLTALRRAYRRAGLDPADAELIEGHGTGTAVGDAVELAALTAARTRGAQRAALGSIKANLGHTKAAAGAAGLLKAIAAVHRGLLPPTVGCTRPHPLLEAADVPLQLLSVAEEWTSPRRIAGVSSMGFGGINAHVVVQSPAAARPRLRLSATDRHWSRPTGDHEIVAVSANSPGALGRELTRLADAAAELSGAEVRDAAVTRWRGGPRGPFRAAMVARTPDELATSARAAAQTATSGWSGRPCLDERTGWALGSARAARVGLLLPGQAAPVRTDPGWWASRLDTTGLDRLPLPTDGGADTATAQPWIVAQTLLGLDWLTALGCEAALAAGHSLGEISGLYWAGALTRAAALDLAVARGRLMADLGTPGTGMVALGAASAAVAPLLAGTAAVISAYNASDRVVVSGPMTGLEVIVQRARSAGIGAVRLDVSHGFHSAAMAPVEEPLKRVLDGTDIVSLHRRLISTVSGTVLDPGTAPDEVRKLLLTQLTDPVRFADAVAIVAAGVDLLVEVGPGTILTGLAAHNAPDVPAVAMDTGGNERRHAVVTAVLAACADADLEPWFADRPYRILPAGTRPRFLPGACATPAAAPEALTTGTLSAAAVDPAAPVATDPSTSGSVEEADALAVVVDHLARTLELPADRIGPDMSLLGELHLSSLEAMQTITRIAGVLGVVAPEAPPSIGSLTVRDLASLFTARPAAAAGIDAVAAAPVAPWIRAYADTWVTVSDPVVTPPATRWTVVAPPNHPWHRLASDPTADRRGLAVALDDDAGPPEIVAILHRAAADRFAHVALAHRSHPAAVGIARALHAELEQPCDVIVIDLAEAGDGFDPVPWTQIERTSGFCELIVGTDGTVRTRSVGPVALTPGQPPLEPGEVCLVTGGTGGITAQCARELAARTGAVLVLLGRTAADHPRVVGQLAALREAVVAHYVAADLGDETQVAKAVAVAAEYGVVRGLLHGAAVNEPRLISDVGVESLGATLAPKVDGLDTLLRIVGDDLRVVAAFGSIIGRQGLAGQSEYCIANDWMRCRVEAWAAAHSAARVHTVMWSVWEGSGMAERLGVVNSLRTRGVQPINTQLGTWLLLDLIADCHAPITVLATSRFVPTETLHPSVPGAPWLRFGERRPVFLPSVEAVFEAALSLGDDPYLDEHRVGGVAVLPAVVGAEAMAQATSLLGGDRGDLGGWSLADLRFTAPVTIDDVDGAVLRTVALAAPPGSADPADVDVVLRSSADGFTTDRFLGRATTPGRPPSAYAVAEPPPTGASPHPFYGEVLFHRGRFRRLLRYDHLSAFTVQAWITAGEEPEWFGPFHDQKLVLGDLGAFDAALHVLLPCVPHRLALPIGAERFSVWHRPCGPLRVHAVEQWHGDGEYVFDVDLVQPDGVVAVGWAGLRLRATGQPTVPTTLPIALVGPWLSRRLLESGLGGPVELTTPDLAAGPLTPVQEFGPADRDIAVRDAVAARTGNDLEVASTRVRAARAALDELAQELALGRGTDDGLLEICCGKRRVVTAAMDVDGQRTVVVAEVGPDE